MNSRLKLLIAGRSKEAITRLESQFSSQQRWKIKLRHIVNGHADPFYGLPEMPDLLVLHVRNLEGGELEAMLDHPAGDRPPMVVVSDTGDSQSMRLAMKAGARDFLVNAESAEVLDSVAAIGDELCAQGNGQGRMVAVVNAKGGSGATFLACNLAHLSARTSEKDTALIGLDLQFPTLPSYFDMKIKHSILQAIESVDELDEVAIEAMMASHESGLKILAGRQEDFRFNFDSLAKNANRLFDLLQGQYENIVVDVPRRLDELNAQVLSRTSRIVLVVQQSLPHIHDATRLQQLLRDQLGLPAEHLIIAVNRYSKGAEVQLEDIRKAFPDSDVVTIANQFRAVSESINLGVPMYDQARQSVTTRELRALQSKLFDVAPPDSPVVRTGFSTLLQKTPLKLFGGSVNGR